MLFSEWYANCDRSIIRDVCSANIAYDDGYKEGLQEAYKHVIKILQVRASMWPACNYIESALEKQGIIIREEEPVWPDNRIQGANTVFSNPFSGKTTSNLTAEDALRDNEFLQKMQLYFNRG
jgi:hypothetical protein